MKVIPNMLNLIENERVLKYYESVLKGVNYHFTCSMALVSKCVHIAENIIYFKKQIVKLKLKYSRQPWRKIVHEELKPSMEVTDNSHQTLYSRYQEKKTNN